MPTKTTEYPKSLVRVLKVLWKADGPLASSEIPFRGSNARALKAGALAAGQNRNPKLIKSVNGEYALTKEGQQVAEALFGTTETKQPKEATATATTPVNGQVTEVGGRKALVFYLDEIA